MSRRIQFYCTDCQTDGPIIKATPLGASFGTEQNAKDWFEFIEHHMEREHDMAIAEVPE